MVITEDSDLLPFGCQRVCAGTDSIYFDLSALIDVAGCFQA